MKTKLLNLFIIIIGLLLIVNLTRSIVELLGSWNKIDEVKKEMEFSQKKNDELKIKLEKVQSREFIEKIARDKLGLAKEGETVVILPSIEPEATKSGVETNLPNWQKWWQLFFWFMLRGLEEIRTYFVSQTVPLFIPSLE
mgnify:CR=1 FL=1